MVRVLTLGLSLVLALMAEAAQAQAVADRNYAGGPPITDPIWTKRPSGNDLMKVYPKEARKARASGYATISCIAMSRKLADCATVVATAPEFGEAALKLVPLFEMHENDAAGVKTEGRVIRIPIMFHSPN